MSGTRGTTPTRPGGAAAALSLVIWLGLSGCGQSGALVLPEPAAPPAGSGNGATSNDTEDTEDE